MPAMRASVPLLVGLVLASGGCKRQDAEHLSGIGHHALGQLEGLAGGPRSKLADGWQAVRGGLDRTAVDTRVALRLRWDRIMEGAAVTVSSPAPGVVELRGTLASAAQQRRAVELARLTQGVEKVVDALEVDEKMIP
jgi:hypothetical protein